MSRKKFTNLARVVLAAFVVLAAIGFSYPLLATSLPGAYFGSKITVTDTANTYAIADTDYLQGGHMQVQNLNALLAITAERRSLGMLVTVNNTVDNTATAANQTATYRLVSNRPGTCPTTLGAMVTDKSLDGLASACSTTVALNWAIVIPPISTGLGQFLTGTTDANGNYAIGWATVASGSGGSFTLLTGSSGSAFNIATSGSTYTFNLPTANGTGTSGALSSADWVTFNGKQNALGFVPLNPANNLSELTSATTARTNLGLGTAATQDSSFFLQTANNLSEISVAGSAAQLSARTNLGLGTIATLNSINNSNWAGTALATTNGGTGLTSYTAGDLIYASGTNVLSTLGIGSNGQILTVASGIPSWQTNLGGLFDGTQLISRATLPANGSAVGGTTLSAFIENYFFPAVAPTVSLAASGATTRELGSAAGVTFTTASITKKTNAVTVATLTVTGSGASVTSGGGTDSPSSGTTASLNMNGSITTTAGGIGNSATATGTTQASGFARTATTGTNTNATFTLTASDGSGNSGSSSVTIQYQPKVYEFISNYDYISNPSAKSDSTISSDFVTGTGTTCGSPSCSLLTTASARTMVYSGLSSQFIYYAIPTSFGAIPYTSSTAGFSVQGTHNTAWAQKTVSFTNASGYTQNYYVYGYPSTSGTAMDGGLTGSFTVISP